MAYTEVVTKGWFRRISESMTGILVGFVIIIIASGVLWWNEGRTFKTAGAIAEAERVTVDVSDISSVKSELDGKVIHAIGQTDAQEAVLKDEIFGVQVQDVINLRRKVEYYQYEEHSHTHTHKNAGGSSTTTTTYTYEPNWVSEPINSNSFKDHDYRGSNITLAKIENKTFQAPEVKFGAYVLPDFLIHSIGGESAVNASVDVEILKTMIDSAEPEKLIHSSQYLTYIGENPNKPKIGDLRISFLQIPEAEISIVAQVTGNTFKEFKASNGYTFSRLEMGKADIERMFGDARSDNDTTGWAIRILAIIAIAIAVKQILDLIAVFSSVIPILETMLSALLWIISSVIAIAWSALIIALAWTRFRIFTAGGLIVIFVILGCFLYKRLNSQKSE